MIVCMFVKLSHHNDHPALLVISFVEMHDIAAAVADVALVEWAVTVPSMPASLIDL